MGVWLINIRSKGKVKSILKSISLSLTLAIFTSCRAFSSAPIISLSDTTEPVISPDNASQISEIGKWETSPISMPQAIWSENNREVIVLDDKIATIYDVSSDQQKQMPLTEYMELNPILFVDETSDEDNCRNFWGEKKIISPDKAILVTGYTYGYKTEPRKTVINLWDLAEKKCITQLPEYDGNLTALSFSPSGNFLIFSTDGETYIWDTQKSEITCQIDFGHAVLYPAEKDMVVVPDGWGEAGELDGLLWDIEKCESAQKYIFGVHSPVFSPDGKLLAGTLNNRIIIANAKTGTLIKEIEVSSNPYIDLSFSPDGRFILLIDYGFLAGENRKDTFTLWAVKQ